MIETFSYIRTCSLLVRPGPPADPIPIPVFRHAVSGTDDEPEAVDVAILQELAEIKREIQALRARDATQNASAVPLESAMAMLGCKRSQVFKLLEHHRLERAPKVGRTVMITVASIKTLLKEDAQQKGGARSQRSNHQPESVSTNARDRKRNRNTDRASQDPGVTIRRIAI